MPSDRFDTDTGADVDRALLSPVNLNNDVRTGEITTEFLVVPRPVSVFRDYLPNGTDDDSSGANDGSVSFSNGEYTISTTATGTDKQAFETARIGTYRPGHVALTGIYVRKDDPPVGKAEWGYKREGSDDGFYVRYDSDGSLTFIIERNGTETRIPKSKWDQTVNETVQDENGDDAGVIHGFDAFDGTGPSSIDLDPADGYIYRFDWSWYGGGGIGLNVVATNNRGFQRAFPAVIYEPRGRPSFDQPNQPVFARLDNQGTAESDSLVVQGRQHSIVGTAQDLQRRTEHLNAGAAVGTSDEAVISFRRKAGDEGVEIDVIDLDTGTDQRLYGYLLVDPTFNTSPSWSTPSGHSASETAIEVEDDSDVDTSTGEKYGGFILGSGKNTQDLSSVGERDLPVVRQKPMVLVLRSITGQSATVDASMTVGEKW